MHAAGVCDTPLRNLVNLLLNVIPTIILCRVSTPGNTSPPLILDGSAESNPIPGSSPPILLSYVLCLMSNSLLHICLCILQLSRKITEHLIKGIIDNHAIRLQK